VISVIIPTLDRPLLLNEALRSLDRQEYRDFEVIVVNDGGCSVEDVVERWRARLPLRLIDLEQRQGVSRARNLGIEHANGDLIAFLDDDDVFLAAHLERAQAALRATAADFVYLGALVSERRRMTLPRGRQALGHTKAYAFSDRFLLVANYIHTGSVVVRNFADSRVRFDESLRVCEDWDLWITLRRHLDYRMCFLDELTTIHHRVPGSPGLIADAQLLSPTPLAVARRKIHSKWPTGDAQINAYREWLIEFEHFRNNWIFNGHRVPKHLFDKVLSDLYRRFSRSEDVNRAAIRSFFENGQAHSKDESIPTHKTRDETQLMAAHSVAAEDGSFRGTSETWRRSSA
jgi:glycosyltransferase involved in cell wall biosynthesis